MTGRCRGRATGQKTGLLAEVRPRTHSSAAVRSIEPAVGACDGRQRRRPMDRQASATRRAVAPVAAARKHPLAERDAQPERRRATQTRRRSLAQRASSRRLLSCSLRSTDDTCVSTVFTDRNSSPATSLYV